MSLKRIAAIMRKELIQTFRDWQTLVLTLMLPILELFIIAYIGNFTVEHIPTVVADMSQDARSRDFISALTVSGFFDVHAYVGSEADVIRAIDDGVAQAGVVIPPHFAAQVERGSAQALIIIDGNDPFLVQSGYAAANAIAQTHGMALLLETAARQGMGGLGELPISTSTRILYNPNMTTVIFLVPGIVALVLQIQAITTAAMTVVRELELGTMEQLLATPARPVEIIIGKMVPGILVTGAIMAVILAIGILWFRVPFQGSVWLFIWLSLIFIISGLGLGLLMSTIAKNQRQAQQLSTLLMLITMLLSGVVYTRLTMPEIVQRVGDLIPATYFIRIARGIITKGVGMSFLWRDVVVLIIYAFVVVIISARTFKKRLD
ncbi:MAG: ABC transporter permease [Anaerolineae bacterium]|nr:ABC transporter permease [Anaerolineae bacterium]